MQLFVYPSVCPFVHHRGHFHLFSSNHRLYLESRFYVFFIYYCFFFVCHSSVPLTRYGFSRKLIVIHLNPKIYRFVNLHCSGPPHRLFNRPTLCSFVDFSFCILSVVLFLSLPLSITLSLALCLSLVTFRYRSNLVIYCLCINQYQSDERKK